MNWQWLAWGVLAPVLVAAGVCDLRRGVVYNWLTYPAIVAGLVLGAVEGAAAGDTLDGLTNHILGLGFGFGILFVAYLLGGMGGGDVKLMGAVGALLGWRDWAALEAMFYSFLVGAAIGLIVVIWRGQAGAVLRRMWMAIRILPLPTATLDEATGTPTYRVPFGFAVCVGTLWYLAEKIAGGSLWDVVWRLI
ncbi:MAG: A24 family peptidase [Planctomycetota bacterium]|nr:A24 family peptidase [Planctomycetota bacterium]